MIEPHLHLFSPFALSKGNGPAYKQLATFLEGLIRSSILPLRSPLTKKDMMGILCIMNTLYKIDSDTITQLRVFGKLSS